jgi:hypothetical protein
MISNVTISNVQDLNDLKLTGDIKNINNENKENLEALALIIITSLSSNKDIIISNNKKINIQDISKINISFSHDKKNKVDIFIKTKAGFLFNLSEVSNIQTKSALNTAKELCLSIFTHSTQARRNEEGLNKKCITYASNLFTFNKFFGSTIESIIVDAIKDFPIEELQKIYVNPQDLLLRIDNELKKFPDYKSFTPAERQSYMDQLLIGVIKLKISQDKNLPQLNAQDIYQLDILRLFDQAKSHKISLEKLREHVNLISPLDIPLFELASIPLMNQSDKNTLTQIWKDVIERLFKEGDLAHSADVSDTKNRLTQVQYASQYVEALSLVPTAIRNDNKLKLLTHYYNQARSESEIKSFLLQER